MMTVLGQNLWSSGNMVKTCHFNPIYLEKISYDLNVTSLEWWFVGVIIIITGWWFGTWILFSHILGIIIPTDSYFSRWLKPPTRLFQVCEFIHLASIFFYDWWFIPGLTTWWPVLRSLEYLDLQMIFYKFSMGNPLQYRESIGNMFYFGGSSSQSMNRNIF